MKHKCCCRHFGVVCSRLKNSTHESTLLYFPQFLSKLWHCGPEIYFPFSFQLHKYRYPRYSDERRHLAKCMDLCVQTEWHILSVNRPLLLSQQCVHIVPGLSGVHLNYSTLMLFNHLLSLLLKWIGNSKSFMCQIIIQYVQLRSWGCPGEQVKQVVNDFGPLKIHDWIV